MNVCPENEGTSRWYFAPHQSWRHTKVLRTPRPHTPPSKGHIVLGKGKRCMRAAWGTTLLQPAKGELFGPVWPLLVVLAVLAALAALDAPDLGLLLLPYQHLPTSFPTWELPPHLFTLWPFCPNSIDPRSSSSLSFLSFQLNTPVGLVSLLLALPCRSVPSFFFFFFLFFFFVFILFLFVVFSLVPAFVLAFRPLSRAIELRNPPRTTPFPSNSFGHISRIASFLALFVSRLSSARNSVEARALPCITELCSRPPHISTARRHDDSTTRRLFPSDIPPHVPAAAGPALHCTAFLGLSNFDFLSLFRRLSFVSTRLHLSLSLDSTQLRLCLSLRPLDFSSLQHRPL
jgi:hypothetical protein